MNYPAWQLKKGDPAAETSLAGAGCGVLLRRVLAARGCNEPAAAQAMLGQGQPLSDPFLLKDMDKAVARIEQAVENEELMVIYGDYDVDGISATAILYECLTSQGAHVRCKLPTRGSGYGLTRAALESLAQKGFGLVVTVDNGISAVEEAACARELGLDLIITDHHLPGDTLPDAVAVVDPKRADDESPFKDLCGAGVAFKLCAALEGCDPAELLEMYGELAALGTVADVMPLVGENRTIVREGLDLLQDTMRPGLHALLESAGCAGKPVTADTVSYSLAPRLNAAGCFLTDPVDSKTEEPADTIVSNTENTPDSADTTLEESSQPTVPSEPEQPTEQDVLKGALSAAEEADTSILDELISNAVLDHYADAVQPGQIHVESHVTLAEDKHDTQSVTVYLLVLQEIYSVDGESLTLENGSYIPTAITFSLSTSSGAVTEYWEPSDGSYSDDIRAKFPPAAAEEALQNDQAYIDDLKTASFQKALEANRSAAS